MEAATSLRAALRFAQRRVAPSSSRVPGQTLALYRVACGVTAGEVGQRLNVSKQYVSKLETNGATIESAGRYRAVVDQIAAERRAT
jgi:hypothetical protein